MGKGQRSHAGSPQCTGLLLEEGMIGRRMGRTDFPALVSQVKMIMATNRPDVLDPALMRPGRLDRKIEIPLPNEVARMDILKIHATKIAKVGDIDYEVSTEPVHPLVKELPLPSYSSAPDLPAVS